MSQPWMARQGTRPLSLLSLLVLLALLALATPGPAHADEPIRPDLWVTDGPVHATLVSGNTLYIGGDFTHVGPIIGGERRNQIAALDLTTGQPTAWDPNAEERVWALAVSGGTVYAAGAFTSIGGAARNCIAALEAATGQATAWDPNADDEVYALALSGGTVYAGGDFTSIGGAGRNYIAALDAATGNATAWDPSASRYVAALAVSGDTVYAGGLFASMGGLPAGHLAGILPVVPGTVIIEKDTQPGGGTGFRFAQDVDNSGALVLGDGQRKTFPEVVPDSYTVTEDDPAATPGGYDLAGLVCQDSDPGGVPSATDLGSRTATVNVDPGETVTCIFTNGRVYKLYLPLVLR